MTSPKYRELKDKVIVITGGGGVLCSSLAHALARQGAKVALLDLKEENAQRVAAKIRSAGGQAIGWGADVLKKESLQAAQKALLEAWGPCDILINGAGGNHPKGTTSKTHLMPEDLTRYPKGVTFFDLDPKGIQFVFDLNFLGTLLPTQVFTEQMAGKAHGVVLNISSMNAYRPLTKIPAYSAAKAAVSNFTQWLAVHMAPVGVRVNAIAPGFFLTDQNRRLLTHDDGSITARGQSILDHTPMNRFGEPEDLEGTVLWLLSEGARFVTGVVVPIDGGFSAYSGV